MNIHIVKGGETTDGIAESYGVPEFVLTSFNNLQSGQKLAEGQALLVLEPTQYHTVSANETVYSIARSYGTDVNTLYRNNPILGGRGVIYPEQTLIISIEREVTRSIAVNGYAYPYIDMEVLRSTLPYVSYLTPFTYGITDAGGLVYSEDEELIEQSLNYGVLPLMHLSTLTENGGFSNELASAVLNDYAIQERLIELVEENMRAKDYRGLDIDFEFVYPEDSLLYGEFVGKLRKRLNPLGYEVIAALAPKISDTQKGLLYEGHNFRSIGDNSDAVLLMTYEWGYTYGPAMAVAPIRNVRQVLSYALENILPEKIFLGIPNYGYDWTLPYIKGESRARSISNVEAVRIAARNNAQIRFDETAQSPWFEYTDTEGRQHEVWFEDVRSILQKFKLINEKDLRGAGYWNYMRPFQQNWSLLNFMFDVIR